MWPLAQGVMRGLSLFSSVSYNHMTYGSNVSIMDGDGIFHDVHGAKMTGYPRVRYKA